MQRQRSWLDRQRFRPQQWSTQPSWRTYGTEGGSRWNGFEGVRTPDGLPPEILMVPLPGHTHGNAGIAVYTSGRWKFLAADAYFHAGEMASTPVCPPGLRFYQWMMELDRDARLHNQDRLRALARGSRDVDIFCSHDIAEFEQLSGRSAGIPAEGFATPRL